MAPALAGVLLAACGSGGTDLGTTVCPAPVAPTLVATPTAAVPAAKRTVAKPSPAPRVTASASPKATPSPVGATAKPAPAEPDGKSLLAGVQATMAGLTSLQATFRTTCTSKDGGSSESQTVVMRYRAPKAYRFDVQAASKAMAVGARTVFNDGDRTVKVRAGGLLSLATMTLAMTDANVVNLHGWTPDNLLIQRVVARAVASGYAATVEGRSTVGGTPVTVLKLQTPDNPLDPDIAYERIAFDEQKVLRLWSCHAKAGKQPTPGLLYQLQVETVSLNPPLSDADLKL